MKCTEWHQNYCLNHTSRELLIPQSCHHAVDICAEETSCSTVKLLSRNLPPSFILPAARSKALRSRMELNPGMESIIFQNYGIPWVSSRGGYSKQYVFLSIRSRLFLEVVQ